MGTSTPDYSKGIHLCTVQALGAVAAVLVLLLGRHCVLRSGIDHVLMAGNSAGDEVTQLW